ncbi:DUF2642 domain-containing protein [Guptibacillus algicola]|uniref:DUF2642 domain-containing protein n=1 Tax=Guptibacillus algicola TaxID=225844 RepID=UPI001CD1C526|nr:DUF2642 domain-containing protein [Alkalihalobacillus algicola]MCA0987556.1 YuzF family protein [Alkalihalobacillus algicola]
MTNRTKSRYASVADPFLLNRLHVSVGKNLIVQTKKDTLRGILVDVQPNLIVLCHYDEMVSVHLNQIIAILPQ